jgi:transposase-like protein
LGVSFRDIEQTMAGHGISVDHATIYRRLRNYPAEIGKRRR